MKTHAKGTFEVKLYPLPLGYNVDGSAIGRMSSNKQFSGDIEGTSKGEMLSSIGNLEGSAGYVAIEYVTGKVNGKKGSFVLQHFGTMSKGSQELIIRVVPNSGKEELAGLSGEMKIDIIDGKHFYDFEYSL